MADTPGDHRIRYLRAGKKGNGQRLSTSERPPARNQCLPSTVVCHLWRKRNRGAVLPARLARRALSVSVGLVRLGCGATLRRFPVAAVRHDLDLRSAGGRRPGRWMSLASGDSAGGQVDELIPGGEVCSTVWWKV